MSKKQDAPITGNQTIASHIATAGSICKHFKQASNLDWCWRSGTRVRIHPDRCRTCDLPATER